MCGNGQIFAIKSSDQQVYYRTEVDDENIKGSAWSAIDTISSGMMFKQLTCGKRGQLMVVTVENKVYSRNGVIDSNPQGT
jgi:hypothetical protein